jgi:predicted dehydrogenase
VDKARRLSTLSGFRKLMESGVEAVALETPPCFFPEHARVAVEAGLHVYMAKPVAVDVPGCLAIEAAAKEATRKGLVFLVDYQIPTDPPNIQVVKMVNAGQVGKVNALHSHYFATPFADPPFTDNLESRLRSLIWCNDVAVGGGYHVNACIHAVDAALWVAGERPFAAMGLSRIGRPDPHGDSHDVFEIVFEFANGLVMSHRGKHLNNQLRFDVVCQVIGQTGYAQLCYGGQASLREEAIAQAACKAAVKARDKLRLDEIEKLVVDLARTEMPYTCPHGRPTLIFSSFRDLNRKFGRE